ncbi:Protein CBG22118 [Caenorhabditis briggsae]|uniref:Protein CBG22118 n=1 Tax=Caenorhabditis briggsae TaxID=6238 RepID=A8Y1K2_CAEBR|nr:Protein CBG22118 [Caenorhabditis briggsae]CAP38772.2 Protein CBG22118 [Caenorhabditis briggsae]
MDDDVSLAIDKEIDRMVEQGIIQHRTVERAMRLVHRREFVPGHQRRQILQHPFGVHHRGGRVLIHLSHIDIYCKVAEYLRIEKGMKVLNVGSGTGFFSTVLGVLLGDQGTNHGLEVHPTLIEFAEKRVHKWVQKTSSTAVGFSRPVFKPGDFNDPELYRKHLEMYDRIYISFVNHDLDCLRRALCMLKINGILIAPMNGWVRVFGKCLCRYTRTTATNANCEFLERMSFASGFLMPDGKRPPTPQFDRIAPLSILCRQALRTKVRSEIYSHLVMTRINASLLVPIGGVPDKSDDEDEGRPLPTLDAVMNEYLHRDEGPSTSGPPPQVIPPAPTPTRRIRELTTTMNSENSDAELQHQVWAELLTNRDRAVRIRAANALGALHGAHLPDALREAIEGVESDENRDQRCVRYIEQGRWRHNLGAGVARENRSQCLANALIISEAIRESKELFPKRLVEYGYFHMNRFNKLRLEATDSRKQVEFAEPPDDPIDVRIGEMWDRLIANGKSIDLNSPWQFGFITQLKFDQTSLGSLARMIEEFFVIARNFQNLMGLEEAPAPELTVTELSSRVIEQFSQICQLWEMYLKLLVIEPQPRGRFGVQQRDDLRGRVHRIRIELFERCPAARPVTIQEVPVRELEIQQQMERDNQAMNEVREMIEELFRPDNGYPSRRMSEPSGSEPNGSATGSFEHYLLEPTVPSSNVFNAANSTNGTQGSSASQRSEDFVNESRPPESSGSSSSIEESGEDENLFEPFQFMVPIGIRPTQENVDEVRRRVREAREAIQRQLNQETSEDETSSPSETESEESDDDDRLDIFNPMEMAFPEGPTPPRIPANERSRGRPEGSFPPQAPLETQDLEEVLGPHDPRRIYFIQLDQNRYHPLAEAITEQHEYLRALRSHNADPEDLERRRQAYITWRRAQRQNGRTVRRLMNYRFLNQDERLILQEMDRLIPNLQETDERIRMWQDTFEPQLVNRRRNRIGRDIAEMDANQLNRRVDFEAIQRSPPDPLVLMDIDFKPPLRVPRVSGDLSDDEMDQEKQELEHRFLAYEAVRRLEDQRSESETVSESEDSDSSGPRGSRFFGPRIRSSTNRRQERRRKSAEQKKRERHLRERNSTLLVAHNSYSNRIRNLPIPECVRRFLADLTEKIDF